LILDHPHNAKSVRHDYGFLCQRWPKFNHPLALQAHSCCSSANAPGDVTIDDVRRQMTEA
jgi:hypothetical protein